jgi:integrase
LFGDECGTRTTRRAIPRVRLYKLERPEIEWWELEQYTRILAAAKEESPEWYAAVCLAGEAGLRIGEVRALRWERDVDLIAGTLTVNEQTRKGITGTPKGRTRRTVPMTATLLDAIKALDVVRRGYVVRNVGGTPIRDGQTTHAIYRICRTAGLPERGWHCLRHTFGTHAALFGVNPWTLQGWMGHKSITETMRYVHVAEAHGRELPGPVAKAAAVEDPTRRIVAMLSARAAVEPVSLVEELPRNVHGRCTTPGGFRESAQNC